jgi:hypothetical protein
VSIGMHMEMGHAVCVEVARQREVSIPEAFLRMLLFFLSNKSKKKKTERGHNRSGEK